MQPLGQAEQVGDAVEVRGIAVAVAGDFLGHQDVRAGVERGQQVEFLEDEADLALAHAGAFRVGERGQVVAVEHHAAAIGTREPAQKIEESRLAAAGRADDADELALLHAEGNTAQRLDLNFAHVVGLAQVFASMNAAPCLIRILHEGLWRAGTRCDTRETVRETDLRPRRSGAPIWRKPRRCCMRLGPRLRTSNKPDALQQIGGRVHSLGEENVGLRIVIVDANLAGDEDGGCVRRHVS